MVTYVGSMIGAFGLLSAAGSQAAQPEPRSLRCTVVETWACEEGKACERGKGNTGERYVFDLARMTYRTPRDRGAITELQMNDGGFMTFILGGTRRYVHKRTDDAQPMTSYVYLSTQDMREMRCTAQYPRTTIEAQTAARRELAGHYYLSGAMETGSELLLRPDGRFAWMMYYGAIDQAAEGTWRVDGDAVLLDTKSRNGAQVAFRQLRLPIDQGSLLANGVAKGRYVRRP